MKAHFQQLLSLHKDHSGPELIQYSKYYLFDADRSKHIQVEAVFTDRSVGIPGLGTTKVPEELVPGLHARVGQVIGFEN